MNPDPPAQAVQARSSLDIILYRLDALESSQAAGTNEIKLLVREWRDEQRKINDSHDERLRVLEKQVGAYTAWHGLQAIFTALGTGFASWFGRQG